MWPQGCEGSSPSSRTAIPRAVLLLAVLFVLGCADSPEKAVHALIQAANSNDTKKLQERVSQRSLPLLNLALEYGTTTSAIALPANTSPYRIREVLPAGKGIVYAVVEQDSDVYRLPLVFERGRWRIELLLMGDDANYQPPPHSPPTAPPLP